MVKSLSQEKKKNSALKTLLRKYWWKTEKKNDSPLFGREKNELESDNKYLEQKSKMKKNIVNKINCK